MNVDFQLEYSSPILKDRYKIGLVITTYNRPRYLQRTLEALQRSQLPETLLFIVDDGSDDLETLKMIKDFSLPATPVVKAYRIHKTGCAMYENLCYGWDLLLAEYGCCYLCNLDPDTVMKRPWLQTLRALHEQETESNAPVLVTGFNAYQHPILANNGNYYQKASLGGLNLFFDCVLYQTIVRPALVDIDWDWRVVRAMQEQDYRILCTRPSVIQHIGREGFWSGKSNVFDFAVDYGSANPFYTMISTLYFRGQRRGEKYLNSWKAKLSLLEMGGRLR